MNLNSVAQRMTRAVTPPTLAYLNVSVGATSNPDYSRSPQYQLVGPVLMDVQALSSEQIRHVDALNISGILRTAYFNGLIEGLNRPAGKGGDLITFTTGEFAGTTWLCVQPLENWDTAGWVKVVIQLQAAATVAAGAAAGGSTAAAESST